MHRCKRWYVLDHRVGAVGRRREMSPRMKSKGL